MKAQAIQRIKSEIPRFSQETDTNLQIEHVRDSSLSPNTKQPAIDALLSNIAARSNVKSDNP